MTVYRLALDKEGRTRKAARMSSTLWRIDDRSANGTIVTRVFADMENENTQCFMQTDTFAPSGEWLGMSCSPITQGAAWHWCEENAEAIVAQAMPGERFVHWNCLRTKSIPPTEPVSLAAKISCRYPIAKEANCF